LEWLAGSAGWLKDWNQEAIAMAWSPNRSGRQAAVVDRAEMSMTRDDQAAFIQAMRAAPEDDALRLVYSDWLEEQGEPARAEFIRVQCELARLPKRSPRRKPLARRESDLQRQFLETWLRQDLEACGLWDLLPQDVESIYDKLPIFGFWVYELDRGFLADLGGTADALLEAMPYLDRLPPLRSLYLCDFGPKSHKTLGKLLRWPGLGLVSVLRLHPWDDFEPNQIGDAGVVALARSANVSRLVSLSLGQNGVADAGVVALAASSHLPALEELYLNGNEGIGSVGAWALVRSPALARLRVLDLEGTGVRAGSPVVNALRQRFGKKVSV